MRQLAFQKKNRTGYGGDLQTKRKGRSYGRPLSVKDSMHLTLRSTKAVGPQSFRTPRNFNGIEKLLYKFAEKYGIKIYSYANNHNHLHVHFRLTTRHLYRAFIRALTSAIAMLVTGCSRWKKATEKFWDRRPYTEIGKGRQGFLNFRNYIRINQLEAEGFRRGDAELMVKRRAGNLSLLKKFAGWVPI